MCSIMLRDEDINRIPGDGEDDEKLQSSLPVQGMYKNWFLDYASYVILERAVPTLEDGLKPVQRRILHAMRQMHDGRYHKVANVIGQTMQFHPHGDAAIGDALVKMGQKELLIDPQGNWGDVRTGDPAAASRYIEARLTPFALQVVFNPKTTTWQLSYDGRKKEPVTLPVKFPLVLAMGVEGIAVGLSTKILPHNLLELLEASINVLKGKKTNVLPDFHTGCMADFSQYDAGRKGSKVRIRSHIEILNRSTLLIKDIPYNCTTTSVIDSIIRANDKGKLKIKKVSDNTAQDVEILVELPAGVSPEKAVDALYAFTDCEVSISPNACVIYQDKPQFLDVDEILRISTEKTRELLKLELEIKKDELEEKWHFASLERIFIENRIYHDIETCETWESVIETIDRGLEPFKPKLRREVTEEDIIRLTEIKIKRITAFDSFKANDELLKIEETLKEVLFNLKHLTDFAIAYFKELIEKYGKHHPRRTEIRDFDKIEVSRVAANNVKLYVNKKDGFIGWSLKKDEFISECSDIDDIIVFRKDCHFLVSRMSEKAFVGKDIIYAGIWKRNDNRTVYHMIYSDLALGRSFVKRFNVTGITRDKEYNLASTAKKATLIYFSVQSNSESEIVSVQLSAGNRAKIKLFDFDFSSINIKSRSSKGNIVTKYPIKKVVRKAIGTSTLGGQKIWYDEAVGRFNADGLGKLLGTFDTGDLVLAIYKDGNYELRNHSFDNRFDINQLKLIEKFDPSSVISIIYYDGSRKCYMVKRFQIETRSLNQKFKFISESRKSKLVICSSKKESFFTYSRKFSKKEAETFNIKFSDFIEVKGWKAIGNKLGGAEIRSVKLVEKEDRNTEIEKAEPVQKKPADNMPLKQSFIEKSSDNPKKKSPLKTKEKLNPGSTIEWDFPSDESQEINPDDSISDPGKQGELF